MPDNLCPELSDIEAIPHAPVVEGGHRRRNAWALGARRLWRLGCGRAAGSALGRSYAGQLSGIRHARRALQRTNERREHVVPKIPIRSVSRLQAEHLWKRWLTVRT